MYTTKDYLTTDPWTAVINRINEMYLTQLTPYTAELKKIESLGGTKTKITVDARRSIDPANLQPEVTRSEYIYDRLDLATFFAQPSVKKLEGFSLPTDTFKVLNKISELNGIVFTLNDFVHVRYDEYLHTYTLKANPKSLRFVGQIEFQLVNTTKQLLPNVGDRLELEQANARPLGSEVTKVVGQYATSGFDFTDTRDFFISLHEGSTWPSGRKLAAVMNDVTGYPWVCTNQASDWNIAGEVRLDEGVPVIVYNGPVLPRYTPRKDIQRVCVLKLSELSTNVGGYLLLHYN